MKASYLTGHGDASVIALGELPTPEPGPGEVRVRVRFAALNHLDVWVRRGMIGAQIPFPRILCGDGAGTIDKVGAGVSGFHGGEEVILHPGISCGKCEACLTGTESLCSQYEILGEHRDGAAAEYVVVPAANAFLKPKAMPMEEAASVGLVYTTAWQMVVRRAQVKAGDWVLVQAAGSGVSSAAIQIARHFGGRVIATASHPEKLKLAGDLGAEVVVDYSREDFLERVKQVTEKRGVDVIIDHVGESAWEKNLRALKWGGTLVTCGASSGFEAKVDLRQLFYRQLSLLGSTMGSKRDFPEMLALFGQRQLRGVVDQVFPLREMAAAQQRLESREVRGKVLLDVNAT